ncbi:MAG TPA: phosphohydrolase [Trueperaceae bacterium]|nr:phosphohydrolase [Trueperaceae bacterium]
MRLFAIADPHLSKAQPKPMDIFGSNWQGHPELFFENWQKTVYEQDIVLIPGDISWAMKLEDALLDLEAIAALPGKKVLLKGNHDYWWTSISKLRNTLPEGIYALQNDAIKIGNLVIAGSRGWVCPNSTGFSEKDNKIYLRELHRLELSIQAAQKIKSKDDYFVIMLHFPPTNVRLEPNQVTKLIKEAKPNALVFGHIHGEFENSVIKNLADIDVHFVAADALKFVPKLIKDDI